MTAHTNLSKQIAKLRKQEGMTQEQLANRLGVSFQAISKWENDQSCPDIALLPLLADVFQVTIDDLFGRRRNDIDLRKGLAAEYLLDGDAADSSGNELHGRVCGAAPCADRFGRSGRAMAFDGRGSHLIVETPPPLSPHGFSLSLWCYYDDGAVFDGWSNAIISQDGYNGRRAFQLSAKGDRLTFHRFMKSPDLSNVTPIRTAFWYHVVVTYGDGLFKKYVNGRLVQQRNGVFEPSDEEPIYIGRKSTDEACFFFKGKIDDIRLYHRAVNAHEIEALFLENGWLPLNEPRVFTEAGPDRVLECLEDIRMTIPAQQFVDAVMWYESVLGFKGHKMLDTYVLSLNKGPNLLLQEADREDRHGAAGTPFIFRTKRNLTELKSVLSDAGAEIVELRDEGFAVFLEFTDPYGYPWMFMNDSASGSGA